MSPDTSKLSRLRGELGANTSMVRELVDDFATGVGEVRLSSHLPMLEQAEVIHRLAGTAAMLAPDETLLGLNQLEQRLRESDVEVGRLNFGAMCTHLDEVLAAFEAWVQTAPPDGEPVTSGE